MAVSVGKNNHFILFILCIILLIIAILLFPFGGIIGIILGILVILLACIGIYGAWTHHKTALFVFLIGAIVLFIFAVIACVFSLIGGNIFGFILALVEAIFLGLCCYFGYKCHRG